MRRKPHVAGPGKIFTSNYSEPTANPAAGPRRRLLRALGGSGGVVLGTILASKWHKPVVEAVVLPAHAQTSAVEATASCAITLSVPSFNVSTAVANSLSLFVNGSVLGSVVHVYDGTNSPYSTSLAASSTFPPGTYTAGLSVVQDSAQPYYAELEVECCETSFATSGYDNVGTAPPLVISDDGECSLEIPGP
ncbi:MAG TPA: hypothetical protein VK973_07970 [Arenicellales bacterium]|nr:hypothetical protein [Arenicellales bacterium]